MQYTFKQQLLETQTGLDYTVCGHYTMHCCHDIQSAQNSQNKITRHQRFQARAHKNLLHQRGVHRSSGLLDPFVPSSPAVHIIVQRAQGRRFLR